MDFLDYLKKAAKSGTSVYTRFLQQYNFDNRDLHVFFEGKDDPSFYSNFIERYEKKNQRTFYYKANNKKSVYHNFSLLDWSKYEKRRVLFFVDKDFRDILNQKYPISSNIFETKFYSIENYLVNKSLFKRCLRDLLTIDDDVVINKITKEFSVRLIQFHLEILPIIALILYYRENQLQAQLNNIDLNKFFEFDTRVKRKKNIKKTLEKSMSTPIEAPWKEVLKYLKILVQIKECKIYVRGKFELWFFVKFINSLPDVLNHHRNPGDPKIRLNVNLSDSTAIQILAPRMKFPKDLKKFLNRNLKK